MKRPESAWIILRQWLGTMDWWATVRLFCECEMDYVEKSGWFSYDTARFPTKGAALKEAKAFCKWKGLKIKEICEKA